MARQPSRRLKGSCLLHHVPLRAAIGFTRVLDEFRHGRPRLEPTVSGNSSW